MFEYRLLTWSRSDEAGVAFIEEINAVGSEGWRAVSMVPQGANVPMPGMGAKISADLVVLLIRDVSR